MIETLGPGASVPVSLKVAAAVEQGRGLGELVFGPWPADGVRSRTEMTRRTVLDQLWWNAGMGNGAPRQGPLIFAWTSGPELSVELGTPAKSVGDTLHLYPATMGVRGPTVWTNPLLGRSVIASDANEAGDQGLQLSLSRGTLTAEWRPLGYGGPFTATSLSMVFTQGDQPALTGRGPTIVPLPPDQQPPQDDPVGDTVLSWDVTGIKRDDGGVVVEEPARPEPAPVAIWDGIPDVQLFDRTTDTWVELPHPTAHREFSIADPTRYVDDTGAFLVRFVNRGGQDMTTSFTPLMRMEGEAT